MVAMVANVSSAPWCLKSVESLGESDDAVINAYVADTARKSWKPSRKWRIALVSKGINFGSTFWYN
jgi:hypothetical protein